MRDRIPRKSITAAEQTSLDRTPHLSEPCAENVSTCVCGRPLPPPCRRHPKTACSCSEMGVLAVTLVAFGLWACGYVLGFAFAVWCRRGAR